MPIAEWKTVVCISFGNRQLAIGNDGSAAIRATHDRQQ
jgi:hypothetical protein